jgi:uncharacterized membrane protein
MSSTLRWPDAALGGLASSMRTSAGPALLAVRGRISGRTRVAVLLAAAGELVVDKTPAATNRTAAPALIGRIAAGAHIGREVAGNPGIAAGGVAAAVGTYATFRARQLAVERTGLPDPVLALGEDAVALAAAALATRSDPREDSTGHEVAEPPQRSILRDGARGVLIGAIATATMTLAQGAEFALTDAAPSDAPATVAEKVKRRLGAGRIKRRHKPAVNQAMHWAYGTSWGMPYGVVAGRLPVAPEISGPACGLLVWGAGLAIQPAVGVAEPPWRRSATSLGSEALFHLVYGIGAAAAQRSLPRPA